MNEILILNFSKWSSCTSYFYNSSSKQNFWIAFLSKGILIQGAKTDLWKVTPELIRTRLPRYEINYDDLSPFESKKLWMEVSKAIQNEDQDKVEFLCSNFGQTFQYVE